MNTEVEISGRHVHFSDEDFHSIFEYEKPKFRNFLSQKNQYAARETVEVVGPKNRIQNVRVMGPNRKRTQLEISRTDSIYLGIDAPLKLSGDLPGAEIKIVGPKGEIIKRVAIVAKRHIHLNNEIAKKNELRNSQRVKIKVKSKRSLIFDDIIVRVGENFNNQVHLDTDEANAAGIRNNIKVKILR